MTLHLTASHLKELYKNNYTVDMIVLLQLCHEDADLNFLCENSKLNALYATLERKGLLASGGITQVGRELLNSLSKSEDEVKIVKKRVKDDSFDRWWAKYPGTDSFEYNGKKFSGTRALRVKKEDCKAKIHKIILEAEYTIDDLIGALEIELSQKKENSFKTGQNKLSYLQNSLTYLNQKTYEPYIELYKAGHKIKEEQKYVGGVEV